jgi:transposase
MKLMVFGVSSPESALNRQKRFQTLPQTEHVREKFSCRVCEKISQPPAPFHVIARGFAGPSLLVMILVDKYANHQPLNRQSEQFAREGIELSYQSRPWPTMSAPVRPR